jgi:hypothetical protein
MSQLWLTTTWHSPMATSWPSSTPISGHRSSADPKQRPGPDFRVLREVAADVEKRLPSLQEPARNYFEEAVAIAYAIVLEDREPPAT